MKEAGFMFFNRMSDDGGGDCSICTGGEIGKFSFFLLVAGKKVVVKMSDGGGGEYTKVSFVGISDDGVGIEADYHERDE